MFSLNEMEDEKKLGFAEAAMLNAQINDCMAEFDEGNYISFFVPLEMFLDEGHSINFEDFDTDESVSEILNKIDAMIQQVFSDFVI